jgi:ribosomal protein S12 methylthiotransferase
MTPAVCLLMLLEFLAAAELDRVGCFTYSPVEGAAANALPGPVPEPIKEAHKARLMQLQETISEQRLRGKVGETLTVLVDEVSECGAVARSPSDALEIDGLVYTADGQGLCSSEFARVRVVACDIHDLYAEVGT